MRGVFLALLFAGVSAQFSAYYCDQTTANRGVYWQVLAPSPCDCASISLNRNYNNVTRVLTAVGPPSDVGCCSASVANGATYTLTLSLDGRRLLGTYHHSSVCSGSYINLNLTRADGSVPCFTGIWNCPGGFKDLLHLNADGLLGDTSMPTGAPSPPTISPSSRSPSRTPTTSIPTRSPTPLACSLVQSNLTQSSCSTVTNNSDAPTPGQPPGYVVSVVVDLHATNGSNASNFTFQLPIDANLKQAALQRISDQGCITPDLRCEWLNPASGHWEDSGCTLVAQTDVAAHCDCSHLTVFSLVLRSKSNKSVLCQARTLDYVMLALFALMAIISIAQCVRLMLSKQERTKSFLPLLFQHVVLMAVCILRLAFLSAKPILEPETAVLIALLPTLFELGLLLYIGSLWTAINLNPLNSNSLKKLKIPLAVAMSLCFCLTLTTPIFMSAAKDESTRSRLAEAGSYQMSVVTGLTAILIVVSGLGLVRVLSRTHTSSSATGSAGPLRRIGVRLTLVAVGAGTCLLILSILWAVAVSGGVMGSTQASEGIDGVFYCTELILLGLLLYLFQAAVNKLTNAKPPQEPSESDNSIERPSNSKWVPLQSQRSDLSGSARGGTDSRNEQIAALLEENRKIPALQQELEQLKKQLRQD